MTLDTASLLSLLLVPPLLGAGILRAIGVGWRTDRLAFFGWAHAVGALAVGALVFAFLALHLPLESRLLAPLAAGVGAVLLALFRDRPPRWAPREPAHLEEGIGTPAAPLERAFFAAVVAALLAVSATWIVDSLATPIVDGDEAHLWASRAKVAYESGGFGERFERDTLERKWVQHADYPPLNPLLQVWVFAHAGRIVHAENRLPILLFVPALILMLAGALRRRARPALAAVLLVLVVGQPWTSHLARLAFSEMLVACGALMAVDAWMRRDEEPSRSWVWLCALGLSLLVWSKNEGLMIAAVFGAAALFAELVRARPNPVPSRTDLPPRQPAWTWLWLPVAFAALQLAFNRYYGLESDIVGRAGAGGRSLVERLSDNLGARLRDVAEWHVRDVHLAPWLASGSNVGFDGGERLVELRLLIPAFLLLVLLFPLRVVRGAAIAPTLGVLGVLLVYPLVFVASPHADLTWHLITAADRVTYHVVPATALLLAVAIARVRRPERC